ncbi:MAG: helix-hairpin-helix domain-containing protein [Phycisphaerae bacterium]
MSQPKRIGLDLSWKRSDAACLLALALLVVVLHGVHRLRQPVVTAAHELPTFPQKLTAARERIDPSTAPLASLVRLPGVGPSIARNIIAYRREHGPESLANPRDLLKVPNIGPYRLKRMSPFLRYDRPEMP